MLINMEAGIENDRYFIINTNDTFNRGVYANTQFSEDGLTLSDGADFGYFVSHELDSLEKDNPWRSVSVIGNFPEGTKVTYTFYVVNHAHHVESILSDLHNERLKTDEKLAALKPFERQRVSGDTTFLLADCIGRYLFVKIELDGHQSRDIKIQSIRIYCSQESMIRYLPEIFKENGTFLDRYLRIISLQYTALENTIADIARIFNPASAPEGMLEWLARLVGIDNLQLWSPKKLRRLLESNVYLKKGTPGGLCELIEIYTSHKPYIIETFKPLQSMRNSEASVLYKDSNLLVLLPPQVISNEQMLQSLHILVRDFIPANIHYKIILLKNTIVLSHFTYLGINSVVNNYEVAVINNTAQMPYIIIGG